MKHFLIYVTYQTKPGCREQFVRELREQGILETILAEDGCYRYEYFFSDQDENQLLLLEEWESETHQQVHIKQPHMARALELKAKYVENVHVGEYNLLS